MSNLKGTETLKNLMAAFAGESQARNRYTFWSSIAKKEGYVEVSKIFEETANQEKEHAKDGRASARPPLWEYTGSPWLVVLSALCPGTPGAH